ncbi:MAG: [Fe-Fe] hydrogenase large subunit C-terminal domain-containing protein, partial [Candidatus Izemoplasmatales bacterium]
EIITLNRNNCKNCYKCIRNCQVKSIKFSGNQASVVKNECILCGQCYVVCPQNAKEIVSDIEKVKVLLEQNDHVIVSLAPSFIANYNGINIEAMREALKKLGFLNVEETAIGAALVKSEYEDYLDDEKPNIFITSACHSVNLLIQKYYPKLLCYLAPIISPMQAHALDIKQRTKDAKVVFIGPCIAKKDEAEHYQGYVDAVLTYEDLSKWLDAEGIKLKKSDFVDEGFKSRFFPTTGGIIKSLSRRNDFYNYIAIDGVENCINVLEDISKGDLSNCFIEMSSCVGGCINGPIMEKHHKRPLKDYLEVVNYAGGKEIDLIKLDKNLYHKDFISIKKKNNLPTSEQIEEIMKQMGKASEQDELNCGSCGYNTCQEKAVAIFQGKANISMCLPFLKERAENFYFNVLNHTPSGIIILNENLEIQQINKAALKIINLKDDQAILGENVVKILDDRPFKKVLESKKHIFNQRRLLVEYSKTIEESIYYDENYHIIMYLMNDITSIVNHKKIKEKQNQQTIEVANKVVEKQMRIVQEIASLLGETAAETKIILTKLKDQIENE